MTLDLTRRRNLARKVVRTLARLYPDAKCSLDYRNSLQLLIATMLSAQCTDDRVNKVTPALFSRYTKTHDYAAADLEELQALIQSTGFFRNKAKNIIACCRELVEKHGGRIPGTMEELHCLPGVGRKTANVVLGNAFDVPGLVVDTHVQRLSYRMGLTKELVPEKIEQDLMRIIPRKDWTSFGHRMIYHGRKVCQARKPLCDACALKSFCPKIGVTS